MDPRDFSSSSIISSSTTSSHRKTTGAIALREEIDGEEGISPPLLSSIQTPSNGNNFIDDKDTMTALSRSKRRGGRRVIFLSCAFVLLVVIIILIEDESELRRTDAQVKVTTWKDLPDRIKNNQNGWPSTYLPEINQDVTNKRYMDDDTFNGRDDFGGTSERYDKESLRFKFSAKQKSAKEENNKRLVPAKKKLQPFPVIQYDDDNIPQAVAGAILHASDALLCRESVIDYVINATDLKDECDGLKKAYTKHCADEDKPVSATTRHRRRMSVRKQENFKSNNLVTSLQRHFHYMSRKIRSWWKRSKANSFMIEDQVLDDWEDAKYEVQQNWDKLYHDSDIAKIIQQSSSVYNVSASLESNQVELLEAPHGQYSSHTKSNVVGVSRSLSTIAHDKQRQENITKANNLRREEEDSDDDDVSQESEDEETEENSEPKVDGPSNEGNKTVTGKDSNKRQANLALPLRNGPVSAKMLTESLMFQQNQKILRAVQNHTNYTGTNAQEEAAASVKAVSDAAEFISSFLNDPTSVEARTCCTSILHVFHENCNVNEEEELSDVRLFVSVVVIAFCGLVKSLIRHFQIRWLPEAAGCILVGVSAGYMLTLFPHHDMSFDGNWFLRIMVPPIVFEAALSIDKRSFDRHIIPILFYAVIGTLLAAGVTAVVVHVGSVYLRGLCETIPYPEALAFGALISSIDPIAVLSVLSNMGMTDLDTIYVVIFGESLLNDGVAIVLFETLVHFLDDNMEVDKHAVTAAAIHFLVVFMGSVLIGVGSGLCCTVYYWLMHGCQTSLVEILMFCCFAVLPYYICDGIEWSGIVAVVAAGFIMDMYVVGTHSKDSPMDGLSENGHSNINGQLNESLSDFETGNDKDRRRGQARVRRPILSKEGLLGSEAKTHIGFVTEIIATFMETAIFAYLGLFLFSSRYHWNLYHVILAIAGCCVSRAVMIPTLSFSANWITKARRMKNMCKSQHCQSSEPSGSTGSEGIIIDRKMQLVLWFAGLRGAMSFALVEHIPLYDAVTGEGTRLKSELKAMTSASIMFTVFVLGGGTFYLMEALGMAPSKSKSTVTGGNERNSLEREMEMVGLLQSISTEPAGIDNGDETTRSDEDPGKIQAESSVAGDSIPRRPGRPVRRQRKAFD